MICLSAGNREKNSGGRSGWAPFSGVSPLFILVTLTTLAIFIVLSGDTCYAASDSSKLRVGSEIDFPPYAFIDEGGQPAGFSVDLIRAVAGTMDLPIEITTGSWDTVWSELVHGRLDLLPIVARSPERHRLADFSVPHTETYDAFFVRQGNPQIPTIEAAKGKEIVVMRSDAAHHELMARKFEGKLIPVDTIPAGLSLVASGKHDAFLCSKLIGTMVIKNHGLTGLIPGPPVPDYKRVFSFAVKNGDHELMEKLNQGLLIIKTNGEYDQIHDKWLTADDPWLKWRKVLMPAVAGVTAVGLILAFCLVFLKLQVNSRTRELAERNEMLLQAGEHLEERVAQRTVELEQVNASLKNEVIERTKTEEALQQALAKAEAGDRMLAALMANVPEGITICDAEGNLRMVSQHGQDLLGGPHGGKSIEEVLRDWAVYRPDGQTVMPMEELPLVRALKGETVHDVELVQVNTDGRRLPLLCNAAPIRDTAGQIIAAVVAWRDITERRLAEDALRRSEERLNLHRERMPIGYIVYDDEFRFVQLNPAAERIFGYRSEELIGRHAQVIVPPEAQPHVDGILRRLAEGEMTAHSVNENLTRDNRIILCDWLNTPLKNSDGKFVGFLSMVQDVTERRRAEEALRESEARFKLLSQTSSRLLEAEDPLKIVSDLAGAVMAHLDCQAFFNFVVHEESGKLRLNAFAGIPEEEARSIEWLDYGVAVCGCVARDGVRIIAEDICSIADPRTELVKSYGIQAYACHPLMAGGRVIGTLSFGTKTRSRFSPQDLDLMKTVADQVAVAMERMHLVEELEDARDELEVRVRNRTSELEGIAAALRFSEEKLQKSNVLLQKVFDGISDPLIMLDGKGLVTMNNKAATDYYGVCEGMDVLGKPCYQGLRGIETVCVGCEYPFLSAETRTMSFERKGFKDPGKMENVTVYPVLDVHGRRDAVIIKISDITKAKILERQILHNEKLASLGLVTSGIAHEINNPNSFIYFNLPILRRYLEQLLPIVDDYAALHPEFEVLHMSYGELKEDIFKLLGNMEHGTQRISKTVEVLKSFVRKRGTEGIQQVDLKEVLDKVVALCQTELRHKVGSFEFIVPEDLPSLFSDPEALEQVFLNLLINAIHACDKPDSCVRLKVEHGLPDGYGFLVEVSDNGSGIEETVREKIFDPFFTTKSPNEGTGLGLYICHSHVESLGGRIEVESSPGRGSTFRVLLPQASERQI